MPDPDARKLIIASATVCLLGLLFFDSLSRIYPAYWSNHAKSQLKDAVKQCFAARANGMTVKGSQISEFYHILFLNRPGVAGDCSFVVKATDYPWWQPARFNSKRCTPQKETWFAIEASIDSDLPFKEICGDALKQGCGNGGRWQFVVDNRD